MKHDKYSRCVVVAEPRYVPNAEPPIPAAEQADSKEQLRFDKSMTDEELTLLDEQRKFAVCFLASVTGNPIFVDQANRIIEETDGRKES